MKFKDILNENVKVGDIVALTDKDLGPEKGYLLKITKVGNGNISGRKSANKSFKLLPNEAWSGGETIVANGTYRKMTEMQPNKGNFDSMVKKGKIVLNY